MDTNRFIQENPFILQAFLFTDASHYGWGVHPEPMRLSFHGCWLEDLSQLYINILEMMAIRFALKKAIKYIHHSCVMISTNNTTMVSYINRQGRTHSPNLCVEVLEVLHWCLEHDIVIRVCHIPGKSISRPRSLSWMRCSIGEVGNILSWRLIVKYFLWSFPPFR